MSLIFCLTLTTFENCHQPPCHHSHKKVNNHDVEAQDATFTLTNVAPQFSRFNELAWREYECLGADSINIDSIVCTVFHYICNLLHMYSIQLHTGM